METYVYVCVYIYILMLQKCSFRVRVYKTRAYLLRFFSPHTKPNTVAVPSSILANLRNNFNYSLKRKSERFAIMIKKDNQVGPSWICHVVHGHVGSRTKEILRIG